MAKSDTMFRRRPVNITKVAPNRSEVSEARFKRFLKDFQEYERRLSFESTLDAFLDLYSSWKKNHTNALKLRLVMLIFELHRLDSQFECELAFAD